MRRKMGDAQHGWARGIAPAQKGSAGSEARLRSRLKPRPAGAMDAEGAATWPVCLKTQERERDVSHKARRDFHSSEKKRKNKERYIHRLLRF